MFTFRCLCFSVYFCMIVCESYRLSSIDAIPTHYSLTIIPDFDNDTFNGEVSINIKTNNCLESIIFHSRNLTIVDVKINHLSARYEEKSDERISIFYQNQTIQPGDNYITIKYNGFITRSNGFIKASYEYKESKVYLFVTDLEPTYARTVFPCFDEPYFKATFKIRLISPNDTYKAISNMPEVGNYKTEEGKVIYDFKTSLKMSTYLLSFAFTDPSYTYYEDSLEYKGKKIPIKIYTVNASKENNEFAGTCTKNALEFYSNYTNISYPMEKLDMIEYKRNLTAATENWGLITFREGLLTPSLRIYNKYQVKLVVFHELSHFWFGNLVTNNWWNDLWLQEGFATYMSYKLLAEVGKNKTMVDEMKSFNFNDYLDIEIYNNYSAIVSYLPRHKDIEDVFNDLVYYKAAALLLMLEDITGPDNFQKIIRNFLKKHAYSSVCTNSFITAVEEVVSDGHLRPFLETYLFQRKYPIISVDLIENDTYILTQHPSENVNSLENGGEKWTVPITYLTDSTNISRIWLDKDMNCVKLKLPGAKWLLLNPFGIGIYRTVLTSKLWEQIIEHFEELPISMTETILLDVYYSFRFNKINCDIFFKLMERLKSQDRPKWTYFHTMMEHLKDNLSCHEYEDEFEILKKYFKRRLIKTSYKGNPIFLDLESDCNTEYILQQEQYKKNLNECAKWIRENLIEKETNAINSI